jgi:hypothetical protein
MEIAMSWKLLDRPKTSRVTKKLAKEFAEMEAAPHDRPLSERRLQVYGKLLVAGQFRPVTWASALCSETGGLYRVNGKHTSILLSGLETMPEFFVTLEEYECDTLEDVAKLYATFDSSMQSRTAKDIYLSFAATVPELKDVGERTITTAITGIAYAKMGQDIYGRTQPAERAEMVIDHPEFVLWLSGLVSGGPLPSEIGSSSKQRCNQLLRQPVAAAMFSTWTKAKGAASEFWSAVRDESGTSASSADRKLSRYLLVIGMKKMDRGGHLRTAGPREVYVKCLHAWNAWRNKETTNLNYYSDKKVPTVV